VTWGIDHGTLSRFRQTSKMGEKGGPPPQTPRPTE